VRNRGRHRTADDLGEELAAANPRKAWSGHLETPRRASPAPRVIGDAAVHGECLLIQVSQLYSHTFQHPITTTLWHGHPSPPRPTACPFDAGITACPCRCRYRSSTARLSDTQKQQPCSRATPHLLGPPLAVGGVGGADPATLHHAPPLPLRAQHDDHQGRQAAAGVFQFSLPKTPRDMYQPPHSEPWKPYAGVADPAQTLLTSLRDASEDDFSLTALGGETEFFGIA